MSAPRQRPHASAVGLLLPMHCQRAGRVRVMRLLDLFAGAGGCTVGYMQAGFCVTAVDNNAKALRRNPADETIVGDALEVLADVGFVSRFDAIHASPPCQRHSSMSSCRPGLADSYPDLISQVRHGLVASGRAYIIENVIGAPLIDPVVLCGQMFGLELYRHRAFESNITMAAPQHPTHEVPASRAGHWTPGTVMSVAGHISPMWKAREVMGIDWMSRDELVEAIPPAYTEHIGRQLLAHLAVTDA